MWSNNLQAKVTYSCSQLTIEIGKSVLQQSPNSEAADGRGRCRCGATKVLKCSWHGGVHPSFSGDVSYTLDLTKQDTIGPLEFEESHLIPL